jgi:hypothetical protein
VFKDSFTKNSKVILQMFDCESGGYLPSREAMLVRVGESYRSLILAVREVRTKLKACLGLKCMIVLPGIRGPSADRTFRVLEWASMNPCLASSLRY